MDLTFLFHNRSNFYAKCALFQSGLFDGSTPMDVSIGSGVSDHLMALSKQNVDHIKFDNDVTVSQALKFAQVLYVYNDA